MKLDDPGARFRLRLVVLISAFCFLPVSAFAQAKKPAATKPATTKPATVAQAERFIAEAEKKRAQGEADVERWMTSLMESIEEQVPTSLFR